MMLHSCGVLYEEYTMVSGAGMPTEDKEQIQAAAQKLWDQGVDLVIAKLGTKGSLLIQKGQTVQQDIIKAEKVAILATLLNFLSLLNAHHITRRGHYSSRRTSQCGRTASKLIK